MNHQAVDGGPIPPDTATTHMKTSPQNILASTLVDKSELTEEQFAGLQLANLPKKVRLRVTRSNGYRIVVQHVALTIKLCLLAKYRFNGDGDYDRSCQLTQVANKALSAAARLLNARAAGLVSYYMPVGCHIRIVIPDDCNGQQALTKLDEAVSTLTTQARELLAYLAGDVPLVPADDGDFGW